MYVAFSAGTAAFPEGIAKLDAGELGPEVARYDHHPQGANMALDEDNLYFYGLTGSNLMSVPKSGGAPVSLVADWPSFMAGLVEADGYLYFHDNEGRTATLWRVPTTGGTPEAMLVCDVANGSLSGLAVHGGYIYTIVRVGDGDDGDFDEVVRIPL